MNDAIEKALLTWYAKDHPLHLNPFHPAIKLAGEAGELLDLYGKHRYKPGFNWWQCKNCRQDGIDHNIERECNPSYLTNEQISSDIHMIYTSLVLDELGDLWYYLRILAYQDGFNPAYKQKAFANDMPKSLAGLSLAANQFYYDIAIGQTFDRSRLKLVYANMVNILNLLDTTLDELTGLNYIKLNNSTHHGWINA